MPGLADAIEFLEASTPLTGFRYTSNPCGGIKTKLAKYVDP